MNRLSTLAICCFVLLLAACSKEKSAIEYPAEGIYGPNILAEGRTKYPEEVSMEAILGKQNSLKVIIHGVSGALRYDTIPGSDPVRVVAKLIGAWSMWGSGHNLAITRFEMEPYRQIFQNIDADGKILHHMQFEKSHTYRLEIYENGSAQPTRTKIMEVE